MFGREILSWGLVKSIGNGKSTNVLTKKWIFDQHPRARIHQQYFIDLNLEVPSLISSSGEWQTETMAALSPPGEASRILSFSIGWVDDRFI